jgi:hypothetical protein
MDLDFNLKLHYSSLHGEKFNKFDGELRVALVNDFKKKLKQHTGMFTKVAKVQTYSLAASYTVVLEVAKSKKPFIDGNLVKKCAIEMAEAFGDSGIAKEFETLSVSHQTVTGRVAHMYEHVISRLCNVIEKSVYFSLCLDDSTDQTDVSQLLIFVRAIQSDFSTHEELLNLVLLHGTTKGSEIFEAVRNCVDKYGDFDKCSSIVTDGVNAMVEKQKGFSGLLRKSGVKCPIFHCIIHQEASYGKSVQQSYCMKVVVKLINLIRGGNRSLFHRKFRSFLDEIDASYGGLLLHSQIRWLSAGKCLERFSAFREILLFLKDEISSDTTDLEQEMRNPTFLYELAFLTDITKHMNDLNMKLQGKQQNVSNLFGHVNGFRNKLKLFKTAIERNDLTHFPCCKELAEELSDYEGSDFSTFVSNIEGMMEEFQTRFTDSEIMKNDITLFHNPFTVVNEEQPVQLQLELCDLQADPILGTMKEKGMDLFKILPKETCPQLRDFGLGMSSMFGSTYLCGSTFSNMKFRKSRYGCSLTDESLHFLRLGTTNITVDIPALVKESGNPHIKTDRNTL